MFRHFFLLLVSCCLSALLLRGQDTIHLLNPSLEDEPRHSAPPRAWTNCGFAAHSPPDTGPSQEFRSKTRPADGQSFLVLVTRDDGSWERVGGTLEQPLSAGQAYQLRLQLARSAAYFSQSAVIGKEINYAFPVRLRIWGAKADCVARELLAESPPIAHTDWQAYTLELEPMLPYSQLILEAYYRTDSLLPYAGNLCVDAISPLVPQLDSPAKLRARRMIKPPQVPTTSTDDLPPLAIDQKKLRELLEQIQPGQLDQGLYELAIYQRSLRQPPWTIFVKADGSKAARRLKRDIKREIAALGLEAALDVDDYVSVFQTMQWLCTPQADGLGLKLR